MRFLTGRVELQELLEFCWGNQQTIDRWKLLTGFDHAPWVVFPHITLPWGKQEGAQNG